MKFIRQTKRLIKKLVSKPLHIFYQPLTERQFIEDNIFYNKIEQVCKRWCNKLDTSSLRHKAYTKLRFIQYYARNSSENIRNSILHKNYLIIVAEEYNLAICEYLSVKEICDMVNDESI